MAKPSLLVIAGCNGSGKSSFSSVLTPDNVIPFDYDKNYLKAYNALLDFDLRERMAHNKTRELLEKSIETAILIFARKYGGNQNLEINKCSLTSFSSY